MGIPKNTIYYHTRKRFGRKYVTPVFDHTPNLRLGEFLGLSAADGCFYIDRRRYQYTMTITLSEAQSPYAEIIQKSIAKIVGKRPRIDMKKKAVQIVLRGKAVLEFIRRFLTWEGIRSHTIRFRRSALALGSPFLRGVIRGLVAGDGGVYPPKRRISFGVVSKRLASQYAEILTNFGIESHIYPVQYVRKKTLYHVQITGKTNLEKFKLRIGLTDPAKRLRLNLALRP